SFGLLVVYLIVFSGFVITVSHDRYFLDRVVDRLFIFKGKGKIDLFYGNYSDYLAYEDKQPTQQVKHQKPKKSSEKVRKQPRKKLSYNDQKEWNTIEDDIMVMEEEIEAVSSKIVDAGSDIEQVQDLYKEQQQLEQKLEEKMERWEELSLLVEEIEANK